MRWRDCNWRERSRSLPRKQAKSRPAASRMICLIAASSALTSPRETRQLSPSAGTSSGVRKELAPHENRTIAGLAARTPQLRRRPNPRAVESLPFLHDKRAAPFVPIKSSGTPGRSRCAANLPIRAEVLDGQECAEGPRTRCLGIAVRPALIQRQRHSATRDARQGRRQAATLRVTSPLESKRESAPSRPNQGLGTNGHRRAPHVLHSDFLVAAKKVDEDACPETTWNGHRHCGQSGEIVTASHQAITHYRGRRQTCQQP